MADTTGILEDLFSLKGKTALVTGGSAGLGRICAEALASAGARVLIASRKLENCVAVAQEISEFGECEGFSGNVDSESGVAELADELRKRTSKLDILVNNAGATWGADFKDFAWKDWDRVLSVNLVGLFALTRELMPMLEQSATGDFPSRVINMGSVVGTLPVAQNAYSYGASKSAVHHLTKMLSNEFAARNITINAIAPGPFETRMTAFALSKKRTRDAAINSIPMRRLGRASDLSGTLLFLCGRGGSFTTGAVVPLDGGMASDAVKNMYE